MFDLSPIQKEMYSSKKYKPHEKRIIELNDFFISRQRENKLDLIPLSDVKTMSSKVGILDEAEVYKLLSYFLLYCTVYREYDAIKYQLEDLLFKLEGWY